MKISIEPVTKLYPGCKIINVEEFLNSENKWTTLFADGTDVRDPDLYYKYGLNFVIAKCAMEGALEVEFKLLDKRNDYCFPDFKITELQQ